MIKEALKQHLFKFIKQNNFNFICNDVGAISCGMYIFIIDRDYCLYYPNPLTRRDQVDINFSNPNIVKVLEDLCTHYHVMKDAILHKAIRF